MNKSNTKQDLIKSLEETILMTKSGACALRLSDDEQEVVVYFTNGKHKYVSIRHISGIAIIIKVARACL